MSEFNENPVGREGQQPEAQSGEAGWNTHPQPPAGSGQPYYDQRQGGYYGAPYSPPYNNTYPPRPGYGQPGYNAGAGYQQNYNPYEYNANSGWQQQPAVQQQPEKYEWKFEDYEKLDDKKKNNKKRNRGLVVFTVALLCIVSVGLVSLAGYSIYMAAQAEEVIAAEERSADDSVSAAEEEAAPAEELQIVSRPEITETVPVGGKLTIPQVAEVVMPSVVGVIKYDDSNFLEMSGYGSGIIMSEDGYIITNAHVVIDGSDFKVQFADGEAYDAEMIGYDSMTDLAVLKIEAEGLTAAQFGDSDAIKVGESVVAIGNPAGMELASSVTAGIVSAVNREVQISNYSMHYIQTDAAINPGNSGGALANEYGQVIGINSSKIAAVGYEGIGFAIPITTAKPVIDDIIANGRVTGRVMLGITCRTVDEIDARNYQLQMGMMIETIDEASDLNAAGVLRGDILTHIDGERVYDQSDVRAVLDRYQTGDTVELTLYRKIGSKEQTFEVTTTLLESQG